MNDERSKKKIERCEKKECKSITRSPDTYTKERVAYETRVAMQDI